MAEIDVVLADCIDLWMAGQDPAPVLRRHPEVADEVKQLLDLAKAVRQSASVFSYSLEGHGARQMQLRFSR